MEVVWIMFQYFSSHLEASRRLLPPLFFCTGKHSIPRVVEEIILVSGQGRITKVPRIKYFEISYRPMEKPYYTTSNIHCRYITWVSTKLIIKTHKMYIVFARVRFYFISTILDSMDNKSDNSCWYSLHSIMSQFQSTTSIYQSTTSIQVGCSSCHLNTERIS